MKKYFLIGFLCAFVVLIGVDLATGAAFSNYYGQQIVRLYGSFTFYNTSGTAKVTFDNTGSVTGNSALRDTSAFDTTSTTKAIYISGALTTDQYLVTKRIIAGTSTAALTDSCAIAYMAKKDSLIVKRNNPLTSGLKFSWVRLK